MRFFSLLTLAVCLVVVVPVAGADTIYISTYGYTRSILAFSPSDVESTIVPTSAGLYNPTGIVISSSGALFIGNAAGGYGPLTSDQSTIQEYSSGQLTTFADTSSGISNPSHLAFGPGGDLFVTDAGLNEIFRFTPQGAASVFASTGLDNPSGMAFGPSGDLYVANSYANNVTYYSPSGQYLGVFSSVGFSDPYGIAFNKGGNLFVCNAGNNTITEYDSSGNESLFASSSNGLSYPSDLGFDSSGNLFVSNYTSANDIIKFSNSGSASVFDSGGNHPISIYVDPGFRFAPNPALYVWIAQTGGSWKDGPNWSPLTSPNGTGLQALLSGSPTASCTITLDGNQTVGSLTFNNGTASYTLSAGSGGMLTLNNSGGTGSQILVLAGTHSITAAVDIIDGGSTVTELDSGRLAISGNIIDDNNAESLTLNGDGSGVLVLSGTNTYGGATIVQAGTVIATNPTALPFGDSLLVGSAAVTFFAPLTTAVSAAPTLVPEPSTLAQLAFAIIAAFGLVRLRKSRRPRGAFSAVLCTSRLPPIPPRNLLAVGSPLLPLRHFAYDSTAAEQAQDCRPDMRR
jgi:autotransporter-associated beta strand protein